MNQAAITTLDIPCTGYSVKTDVYEEKGNTAVALILIGRTSRRTKQRYYDFLPTLSGKLRMTAVIFDYTGHGDSPFDIEDISPAQNFLEVVTVFDWIKENYPNRKVFVIGSSYGGFLATQLTKYRKFDSLILRAPAIYIPREFYTKKKDADESLTMQFRKNASALAKHPLFARASNFQGNKLLIVHEHDEKIPRETTDAYKNALHPDLWIAQGATHSLDNATKEQVDEYNQRIYDWIKSKL